MLFVNIYHVRFYVLKSVALMHAVLYIGTSSCDYCELSQDDGTCLDPNYDSSMQITTCSARRVVFIMG
jgi:hypothetical protein